MQETLNRYDWLTIVVYTIVLIAIALYHSRKMKAQDDFFLAGRSMSRWPIALSMYMALFSTNSFVGLTGWLNREEGTIWIAVNILGLMAAVPLAIWLFPPVYFRLQVTTAYQYLEQRFNYSVRALAAFLFLGARTMWMSTMLYASSLIISMMLGWTPEMGVQYGQIWAIVIVGSMGLFLAFSGGMHAVIWTDVLQFFVMMTGVSTMAVLAITQSGGVDEVWSLASSAGKFELPRFFSLTDDVSFVSLFLLGFPALLFGASADQVFVQTYFTAKSEREAKRSLWRNGFFLKPVSLLFPFLGLLMFAYYVVHPNQAALMRIPDDALPVFILHVLPVGIRGLMVAAIVAALLTSLGSGMAAMSATVQVDYVRRWMKRPLSNRGAVRLGRFLALTWGIVVIFGAIWVRYLGSSNNIILILNILMYPLSGVLLGIFLLAVLTHRANGIGALIGGLAGFLTVELFPLSQQLLDLMTTAGLTISPKLADGLLYLNQVSSFYYCAFGASATFLIGYLASMLFAAPGPGKIIGLTRFTLRDGK